MYCSNCGTKFEDGARFCEECGEPREDLLTAPTEDAPHYAPPTADAPGYAAPTDAPHYAPPTADAPGYYAAPADAPHYAPPTADAPGYAAAPYETPYYSAPPTDVPEYGDSLEEPQYTAYPPNIPTYAEPPTEPTYEPHYYVPPTPRGYGQPQTPPTPPTPPTQPPQSEGGKNDTLKIVIPIAAIVLLLAILAGLWLFTDVLSFLSCGGTTSEPSPTPASASPSPTPTLASPSPTPTARVERIPGTGGDFRVSRTTEFQFTPGNFGIWQFQTSDNGDSDPFLEIRDPNGALIAYSDDEGGDMNAYISEYLYLGANYTVVAGFYGNEDQGSYLLSVKYLGESSTKDLPGDGGEIRVMGATDIEFRPDESGMWDFRTSDNGDSDPLLRIYDPFGELIAMDDDSGGDSNAMLSIRLEAGANYLIRAEFYEREKSGMYTLTVTKRMIRTLPGEGGEVRVNGLTEYMFTPAESGRWDFITSDKGASKPILSILTQKGVFVAHDDGSLEDGNAAISVELDAGTVYTVVATFFNNTTGSYTLKVSRAVKPGPDPGSELGALSGEGGSVIVSGSTDIAFTPGVSGIWEIRTSDNGLYDPVLALYDQSGLIAEDDDSSGGGISDSKNALIIVFLLEGEEYKISAGFYSGEGSYTVTVSLCRPIPDRGGTVKVTRETVFLFTPDKSGIWEFLTSDNGNSDPIMYILDSEGNTIAEDDDSGGRSNARIITELDNEVLYFVCMGFFNDGTGSYDLTVSRQ